MDSQGVKKDLAAYYDDEAGERGLIDGGASERVPESRSAYYFIDRKVAEALDYCPYRRDLRAMEIGCSYGNMTVLLAAKFDRLTAVDMSPDSIELARARMERHGNDNVEFVADDAEKLEQIGDGSFDVIFSFSTIRYCPNVDKAIEQIHNKLDENGTAIIDFPNRHSPWHWIIKRVTRIKGHIHDNLFSRKELIELFSNAGFRDVEAKYFLFTTRRLPDVLLPLFRVVDAVCERIPGIRGLAGIIMVKGTK